MPTLRRITLTFLAASLLAFGLSSPAQAARQSPFAPWSFFYETNANATQQPASGAIASQVRRFYGTVAINTVRYSPTLYTVSATQPAAQVTQWDCQHKGYLDRSLAAQWASVPIPPDAIVGNDNDAQLVVWQPSTDTVWEFWKARKVNGLWQACWGGRLSSASSSEGVFPAPYGAAASGISLLGGLITLDELRSGHIDHAIAMSLPLTRRGVIVSPANRTDGWSSDPDAVAEGTRLRLDPALDLSTLHLTPVGQMIATAIQRYGVVIRDTSGSVTVYVENPSPYMTNGRPNPYAEFFKGVPTYALLKGVPWDRLQAVAPPLAPSA
jgi:hypothetical protein